MSYIPGNGAKVMDHHEKMRIRAAAFRATRLYPGPIGELISRELLTWEEFGFRLSNSGLIMRLVAEIAKTEMPTSPIPAYRRYGDDDRAVG